MSAESVLFPLMGADQSQELLRPEQQWQELAACTLGTAELFYPPDGEMAEKRRRRERAAQAICAVCPVRLECLQEALDKEERFGIWGGMTESTRNALLKRTKLAGRPASSEYGSGLGETALTAERES